MVAKLRRPVIAMPLVAAQHARDLCQALGQAMAPLRDWNQPDWGERVFGGVEVPKSEFGRGEVDARAFDHQATEWVVW